MSDAGRGRIAIKFGGGPSSSSRSARQNPSSTLGKRSRSHHALGGASDSESEDESHRGRHERITAFGSEGAETERGKREAKKEKEYIIERQGNRNWKEALKARGKSGRPPPPEDEKRGQVTETDSTDKENNLKWGLTIKAKKMEPSEDADTKEQNGRDEKVETPKDDDDDDDDDDDAIQPPAQRTADEEAMDALLGKAPEKKQLTIAPQLTEDDAYRRDVETAGAPSTLEDYEAMPVEEFGAALLRGMGWSGENLGPKVKQVRRRPNRLGLGAKELKEDEDLGGWNQNGGKKKSRPRLDEYRREESKRKEGRSHEDSYKRERERERRHERDGRRDGREDRDRDRDYDRHHRDRHRDYDRDRRR